MKKLLIALGLLAVSSTALAAGKGLYASGSVGYTHGDIDCTGTSSCSSSSGGAKVSIGYQINDSFAIEGSYFYLGKQDATVLGLNLDAESSGFGVRGLFTAPFSQNVSGFAALGINGAKSKINVPFGSSSHTSTQPSFALGVDYALSPVLKVRGEIETFRFEAPSNTGDYNVTSFSVGLKYSF